MAISKVSQYNSSPTTVADYQAQNAHLQAMINKANGSMSILNQDDTTSVPYIALGTYIMMGGTLYVVDTENYTINSSVNTGLNYIKVGSSGDNLIATWTQSLKGYEWNSIYNYYTDGTNALLPYIVDYDGTDYITAQFDRNFNQKLRTTSDVEFNNITANDLTVDDIACNDITTSGSMTADTMFHKHFYQRNTTSHKEFYDYFDSILPAYVSGDHNILVANGCARKYSNGLGFVVSYIYRPSSTEMELEGMDSNGDWLRMQIYKDNTTTVLDDIKIVY